MSTFRITVHVDNETASLRGVNRPDDGGNFAWLSMGAGSNELAIMFTSASDIERIGLELLTLAAEFGSTRRLTITPAMIEQAVWLKSLLADLRNKSVETEDPEALDEAITHCAALADAVELAVPEPPSLPEPPALVEDIPF